MCNTILSLCVCVINLSYIKKKKTNEPIRKRENVREKKEFFLLLLLCQKEKLTFITQRNLIHIIFKNFSIGELLCSILKKKFTGNVYIYFM